MKFARLQLLICIVASGLTGAEALACTCMAPANAAEAFAKSSAVFRGRVTRIYRPLLDRAGITKTGNHRVKFEITKQWKGKHYKNIVLSTRLSGEACGFPFREKKEYLVYIAPSPVGIEAGICTGTKSIADAGLEMEELDHLRVKAVSRRGL